MASGYVMEGEGIIMPHGERCHVNLLQHHIWIMYLSLQCVLWQVHLILPAVLDRTKIWPSMGLFWNGYRKLPRFTTKLRCVQFPYWTWNPHCSGLVPTLQSRNVRPRRWHGTEATDHVTGAVQQQFRTDLNSALFASRPTSWAGPAKW